MPNFHLAYALCQSVSGLIDLEGRWGVELTLTAGGFHSIYCFKSVTAHVTQQAHVYREETGSTVGHGL